MLQDGLEEEGVAERQCLGSGEQHWQSTFLLAERQPIRYKEQLKTQALRHPDTETWRPTTGGSGFPSFQVQLSGPATSTPQLGLGITGRRITPSWAKPCQEGNFLFAHIDRFLGEDTTGKDAAGSRGGGRLPPTEPQSTSRVSASPAWRLAE